MCQQLTAYKAPSLEQSLHLGLIIIIGVIAYSTLTAAVRTGEISIVTPFRYTRLLFAMGLGIIVFAEKLDGLTLIGGFLVIASGLFSMLQQRRL